MTRILCLHGYHGSAEILRRQMAPLVQGLADVEFVCLDAPSLAEGDFGWWHAEAADPRDMGDGGVARRPRRYAGWERSRDWAVSLLDREAFDGVFGFSQGAAMTALLVGLKARFRFAMMVGGFASSDPSHASLFAGEARFDLPSLHLIGRADFIVWPELSRSLASRFKAPTIVEHEGGHVIAADPQVRSQVREFLTAHAPSTRRAKMGP